MRLAEHIVCFCRPCAKSCARAATAKRSPGAKQWSLQQRAKSSVLRFMQELAESSTTLLQPPLRGRFTQFEFVSPNANAPCLSLLVLWSAAVMLTATLG